MQTEPISKINNEQKDKAKTNREKQKYFNWISDAYAKGI